MSCDEDLNTLQLTALALLHTRQPTLNGILSWTQFSAENRSGSWCKPHVFSEATAMSPIIPPANRTSVPRTLIAMQGSQLASARCKHAGKASCAGRRSSRTKLPEGPMPCIELQLGSMSSRTQTASELSWPLKFQSWSQHAAFGSPTLQRTTWQPGTGYLPRTQPLPRPLRKKFRDIQEVPPKLVMSGPLSDCRKQPGRLHTVKAGIALA